MEDVERGRCEKCGWFGVGGIGVVGGKYGR